MYQEDFDERIKELQTMLAEEIFKLVPPNDSHIFKIRPCALDYNRLSRVSQYQEVYVEFLEGIDNNTNNGDSKSLDELKFHVVSGPKDNYSDYYNYTAFQPHQLQEFITQIKREIREEKLETLRELILSHGYEGVVGQECGNILYFDGSFGFHSVETSTGEVSGTPSMIRKVFINPNQKRIQFFCDFDGIEDGYMYETEDNIPFEEIDNLIENIKKSLKRDLYLTKKQFDAVGEFKKAYYALKEAGVGIVHDRDENTFHFINAKNIEKCDVAYTTNKNEQVPEGFIDMNDEAMDSELKLNVCDNCFYFYPNTERFCVKFKEEDSEIENITIKINNSDL